MFGSLVFKTGFPWLPMASWLPHLLATGDLPQDAQRGAELHGIRQLGALRVALHGVQVLRWMDIDI